jgi:hypothetical protein
LSLKNIFDTPLNEDFKVNLLSAFNKKSWSGFIQKYGTHFLDSAVEGGRISSQ